MRVSALALAVTASLTLPGFAQEGDPVLPADATVAPADPAEASPAAGASADAAAAGAAPTPQLALLTLNQDELFEKSAWGSAAMRAAEAAAADLSSENRAIEASLEEEERGLTQKRTQMSAADFAPLARAFDARVEEIRQAQDAKSRAINRKLDEDRKAFTDQAVPLLVELLDEYGAVAIISDEALILSLSSADVTQRAIALMDRRLPAPEGETPPPSTPPASAPNPEQGSPPAPVNP